MTELEVIQDAIKIGFPVLGTVLGATIGAVGTYFVTRLTHRKEQEKFVTERRLAILEEVSELFAEFTDIVAKHWAESNLVASTLKDGKRVPVHVKDNLQTIAQMYHDSLPKLKKAESRLLLLGLTEAHRILRKYVDKVNEFRFLSDDAGQNVIEDYGNQLGKLEEVFYQSVSKVYREV